MNNDTFLIEDSDLSFAKDICKYIDDPTLRERAAANAMGANIAKKYFEDASVDTETGLHNVSQVLEDIEISDIYVNGSYIGVRLYFNESEMCVPKSHFDNEILPVAYMFIEINSELSGGTVTGFIVPSQINTEECHNGYYPVNEDELVSFYDIEPLMVNGETGDLPEYVNALIFRYLDNKLENKAAFYQTLIHSQEGRQRLIRAAKAQNTFKFVSIAEQRDNTKENTSLEQPLVQEDFSSLEQDSTLNLDMDSDLSSALEEFGAEETLKEEFLAEDGFDTLEGEVGSLEEVEQLTQSNTITENATDAASDSITSDIGSEEIPEIIIEQPDMSYSTTIEDTQLAESEELNTPLEIVDTDVNVPMNNSISKNIPTETLEIIDDTTNDVADNVEEIEVAEATTNENENFSTTTTPSINNLEADNINSEDDLESMLDASDNVSEQTEVENSNPQIDELFDHQQQAVDSDASYTPKKPFSLLPVLGIVAVIAASGYFGYNKYMQNQSMPSDTVPKTAAALPQPKNNTKPAEDAMPVETVENVDTIKSEEGNSVSIPAIEQNLDASILVSNLSVSWEVPAGYVSNNTAKRYFTKLGKVIQLNLKTELLLLSKPPITNRIAVELEFNKATQKFDVKGLTASSGERVVDNVITKTVKNALDMNLNMNTSSFGNIQGNPVLIIRL